MVPGEVRAGRPATDFPRPRARLAPGPALAVPDRGEKFDYSVLRSGFHLFIALQDLRLSRFRHGALATEPDRAGALDQSQGVARQPIELPRIVLASGLP